jgi:hypothetical protein
MGVQMSVHVGGCPAGPGFPGILLEACRSEWDDVGVGWGKDWGSDEFVHGPAALILPLVSLACSVHKRASALLLLK